MTAISANDRPAREHVGVVGGLVVATVVGGMVVLWARWGPDWPAQEFRAWVASQHGLVAWTSQWYAGQPLWGYSVLFPVVGGLLGAPAIGFVSVVVTTWLARSLAPRERFRRMVFPVSVAASLIESLLIGQVPFLLGVTFATGALVALVSGRRGWWVALCAAGCSLSSPLAGVGLAIAAPGMSTLVGRRRTAWLAPCLLGAAVSKVAGGADGPFFFSGRSLSVVIIFCALSVLVTRGRFRALNVFALSYLVAALAAFVVPNPVGGNIVRLGTITAIPLAVWFAPSARSVLIRCAALILVGLAVLWPSYSFTSAVIRGAKDPSQDASYYTGLINFLRQQNPVSGRVEIPFTREHWESLYVAKSFPIARGWERQTDLLYNDVLYHPLTGARYRRWLDDNAVSLVALSRSPIDFGGRAEKNLLAHPLPYLTPVWHDANWQVWRVRHPQPVVTGAARLVSLGSSSLELQFTRPGAAVVRIRFQSLWVVSSGGACLGPTSSGWLRVYATTPGRVNLQADINDDLLRSGATCRR